MKKTFLFLTTLLLGVAVHNASATFITIDENGNWATDGSALTFTIAAAPAPAGLLPTLDYTLPFQVTKGALLIYEDPAQTILSDVIYFDGPLTPNSQLYFYSDNTDGSDSLADQNGLPTISLPNTILVTETGPEEGPNGYFGYTPTIATMPGFDAANPGGVTYNFISDVPEPTTMSMTMIAGALLLPFGARRLRMLRKNRTA